MEMTKRRDEGLPVGGPVVREDAARAYAAVGPTKFGEMIDAGEFPPPIMVGNRRKWLVTELDQWLEERKAARDVEAAKRVAKPETEATVVKPKKLKLRRPVRA
jgi:predicted DNA-binding transcriptional regulator AlpA